MKTTITTVIALTADAVGIWQFISLFNETETMNYQSIIWLIIIIAISITWLVIILYYKLQKQISYFKNTLQNQINDFAFSNSNINNKLIGFIKLLEQGKPLPKNMFTETEKKMAEYISNIRKEET